MTVEYRKEVMLNLISGKPDLGKTAVMKKMFILQQVFGVDLEYNFDIYTYGPYAAEVADDLNMLVQDGFVDAEKYVYYKDSVAYRFNATGKFNGITDSFLTDDDRAKIKKVLELFGNKNVKELELDSTIIYVKNQYVRNNWVEVKAHIIEDVHQIKPHFTSLEIERAYDALRENGVLN